MTKNPKQTVRSTCQSKRRSFCKILLASAVFIITKKTSALALPNRFHTANMETQHVVEGGDMPLVRIDLVEGKSEEYRERVAEIVYQTLVDILSVPKHDRFQVITEHRKNGLSFDRDYLGVHRSDDCIFFQITLNNGRTIELKQRFYKALADGLHEGIKLRREDVFINLVEVPKENWSYGNGEAQYAK
jgi:phenylpyruvate tautomerase PptA (4-oxalocrotonate tautomerase family)